MNGTNHILSLLPFTSYNPCWPVSISSHLALYVSEMNSFLSDIQVHLLAPQLLVLRQEGETCLGLLHTLHIPVLEWERQQVLRNKEREREVKTVKKWGEMHLKIKLRKKLRRLTFTRNREMFVILWPPCQPLWSEKKLKWEQFSTNIQLGRGDPKTF